MKQLLLAFFFSGLTLSVLQAQDLERNAGWYSGINSVGLTKKLRLQFDFAVRSTDKWEHVNTWFIRPGLAYNPDKHRTFTLGLNYVMNRTTSGGITDNIPEKQVWEQFWYRHPWGKWNMTHRFSLEQRFVSPVTVSSNQLKAGTAHLVSRFRYWIRAALPLEQKPQAGKGNYLILQNELFLGFGETSLVNGKTFDQNRAMAGIGHHFSPLFDMELGYQFRRIQGRGSIDFNDHILQLTTLLRL